jgi:TPR repeat protein
MKQWIFFTLMSSTTLHASVSEESCYTWFDQQQYQQVIEQCRAIDGSDKLAFVVDAATLLSEVSYERINHIFYYGRQMGAYLYQHQTGDQLYSQLEKYHLKKSFEQLQKHSEQELPMALMLLAKLAYLDTRVIRSGDQKWVTSADHEREDVVLKRFYTGSLERLIELAPDDTEALYLLGMEGVEADWNPESMTTGPSHYNIINETWYQHLLRADELGHPGPADIIRLVNAGKARMNSLEEQAGDQDPDALYALGQQHYRLSHHDPSSTTQAVNYFQQAADMGHFDALLSVNNMYAYDAEKFLKTLQQLIDRDHAASMVKMGDILLCQQQVEKARALYQRAIDLNDPTARYALEDLEHDGVPSAGCGQ